MFPKIRHKTSDNSGFTLLELVIALLLSAVILLILVSTIRLAVRSEEKGTKKQEASLHVRIITSQLSFILRGAFPYRYMDEGKQKYYFEGESEDLSFITTSVDDKRDSLVNKPGLKWVSFSVTSQGLLMKENFFFLKKDDYDSDTAEEQVLDPSVSKIEFEYLDTGEDGKSDPEWETEWSGTDKGYLPAALRVSIVITEDEKDTKIPPFTVRIQVNKKTT